MNQRPNASNPAAGQQPVNGRPTHIPLKRAETKLKHGKRKLWDLPGSCHCMVVGTCLTLADVKSVAKRARYDISGKSDYQLHQFFVSQASYRDSLIAKQTQKLLNRKYRKETTRLNSATTEADLLNHWQVFNDTGKIAAGVWAIFTHPSCTSSIMELIYGEVHMLSHLSGASVHQQAAEVPAIKHETEVLRHKLRAQKLTSARKVKAYQYEVVRLENINQQLNAQLEHARQVAVDHSDLLSKQDSDRIKCLLRETNQLLRSTRTQLQESQSLAKERSQQLEAVKHDNGKLEQLVNYLVRQKEKLGSTTEVGSKDHAEVSADAGDSCSQSLSGKCVLLLGGMPSQCKHFKAFVEANNGDFLHHDGGTESSYSQIDHLVRQADAVFCPVEQVSHNAMNRAKKLCKKAETPLVFLPKSSLSAFVNGIRAIQ
jgi:G3E family GTPase